MGIGPLHQPNTDQRMASGATGTCTGQEWIKGNFTETWPRVSEVSVKVQLLNAREAEQFQLSLSFPSENANLDHRALLALAHLERLDKASVDKNREQPLPHCQKGPRQAKALRDG